MCCLTFEEEHYEKTHQRMPRIGKEIETPEGIGVVVDTNIIKEHVVVRFRKGDSFEQKPFPLDVLKFDHIPAAQEENPEEKMEEGSTSFVSEKNESVETKNQEERHPRLERFPKRGSARKFSHEHREHDSPIKNPLETPQEAPREKEAPKPKHSSWIQAVEEALQATEKSGKE